MGESARLLRVRVSNKFIVLLNVGHGLERVVGGSLESAQTKFGQDGKEVVKDVGLDVFVICPAIIRCKYIELDGDAVLSGLKLTHKECFLLGDFWVIFEILPNVGSKSTDISE